MIEHCPKGHQTTAVHGHCKGCGCCLHGGSISVMSDGPYCSSECREAFYASKLRPSRPPRETYFVFPPVQPIHIPQAQWGWRDGEIICSNPRTIA